MWVPDLDTEIPDLTTQVQDVGTQIQQETQFEPQHKFIQGKNQFQVDTESFGGLGLRSAEQTNNVRKPLSTSTYHIQIRLFMFEIE